MASRKLSSHEKFASCHVAEEGICHQIEECSTVNANDLGAAAKLIDVSDSLEETVGAWELTLYINAQA